MIRHLAVRIGPRETTSAAYQDATRLVRRALAGAGGYEIHRQPFSVPAGVSDRTSVPAGRTSNLVAVPTASPYPPAWVVGAHLDTVPLAPGAEDNASGVAMLLELARMSAGRHPVLLIVFGGAEARGAADDEHHYGSRTFVRHPVGLPEQVGRRMVGRSAALGRLRGMVSLDRVGAGDSVRIRTGGTGPRSVTEQLRATAARLQIPVAADGHDQGSDHWPFEKAGVPAARVGGHPYRSRQDERDPPEVVRNVQLRRTGLLLWHWIVDVSQPTSPDRP